MVEHEYHLVQITNPSKGEDSKFKNQTVVDVKK